MAKSEQDSLIPVKADKTDYTALLHTLAAERGGKCLSPGFTRWKAKYLWQCNNPKHPVWEARLDTIKRGCWCPECGKKRITGRPTDVKQWSLIHGVILLDGLYINGDHGHTWSCLLGHVFAKSRRAMVDAVRAGKLACPECNRRRK